MYQVTAALAALAMSSLAAATTYRVEVGNNGAFTFEPNSTHAEVGDIIEFAFFPRNHSVVQSRFSNPCQSTEGFFSGFMPVAQGEGSTTFRVTVNDTNPIWFYCSQPGGGGHCARGMVGCVNCPESGSNTLTAFASAAALTDNTTVTQPYAIGGGVLYQAGGDDDDGNDGGYPTTTSAADGSGGYGGASPTSTTYNPSATNSAGAGRNGSNGSGESNNATPPNAGNTLTISKLSMIGFGVVTAGLAFFVL